MQTMQISKAPQRHNLMKNISTSHLSAMVLAFIIQVSLLLIIYICLYLYLLSILFIDYIIFVLHVMIHVGIDNRNPCLLRLYGNLLKYNLKLLS